MLIQTADLESLKRDEGALLEVLGINRSGGGLHCPFHDDKVPSFSVSEKDGVWLWKCFSGCGGGTIIDAAMKLWNLTTMEEVAAKLSGMPPPAPRMRRESHVDIDRSKRLIDAGIKSLRDSKEIQDRYMTGVRGLSLETCVEYSVGFLLGGVIRDCKHVINGWIIPIASEAGVLLGVKIHQENLGCRPNPKCFWAPLGREGKHGVSTLWPAPELFRNADVLFIQPGELKALATISCGLKATSPTGGEGAAIDAARIAASRPRLCVVVYDDDTTGKAWGDKTTKALRESGVKTVLGTLGESGQASDAPTSENAEYGDLLAKIRERCSDIYLAPGTTVEDLRITLHGLTESDNE